MTLVETVTKSIWKHWQKWSVFKTIRFHMSSKRRNRINLNTVPILAWNFTRARRFKIVNLARSAALAHTITTLFSGLSHQEIYFVVSPSKLRFFFFLPCWQKQNGSVIIEPRSPTSIMSAWERDLHNVSTWKWWDWHCVNALKPYHFRCGFKSLHLKISNGYFKLCYF